MEILSMYKQKCQEEFKKIVDDTSIESVKDYLEERSTISLAGRAGAETIVNKEALRLAAVYLQDYMNLMSGDI